MTDYVRCIDPAGLGGGILTHNKVYRVLGYKGKDNCLTLIVNDKNHELAYYSDRFEPAVANPPHVHAGVIHAYADGAEIELKHYVCDPWRRVEAPVFAKNWLYRVKPTIDTDLIDKLEAQLVSLGREVLSVDIQLKEARGE